jgi:mannose-6-phosphate isomerase-like protein (cupin superfamily)
MVQVGQIDDMAAYIYYCTGTISWHRHLDEDELFLVWRGAMTVETPAGPSLLGPWDLVVVPKGTIHRSGSGRRATVLLVQPRVFSDRQNGDRHWRTGDDLQLKRVSVSTVARSLTEASPVATVGNVGNMAATVTLCSAEEQIHAHARASEMLLVHSGKVTLSAEGEDVELVEGELAVVPRKVPHRVRSLRRATLLRFSNETAASPRPTSPT